MTIPSTINIHSGQSKGFVSIKTEEEEEEEEGQRGKIKINTWPRYWREPLGRAKLRLTEPPLLIPNLHNSIHLLGGAIAAV